MKKNVFYFIIITLHFVLAEYRSVGQLGPEIQLTNPAPLSPNAASIQRFGDIPVGRYTGLPNIDIPVYNIKTTHLEVPVSLSYHASGVKIEDVASLVGLGWSLNAGGVITRNVRGLPDEHAFGYLSTNYLIDQYPTMDTTQLRNYYYNISSNLADPQPDIFSFNAGPLSGKFHFKSNGNIICIPQKKIKIEYGNFGGTQNGFLIINTDGVKYYFLDIEETSSYSSSLPMSGDESYIVSAWYLTKIISSDNKDSVTFEYESQTCTYNSISTMTHYITEPNADDACGKPEVILYSQNNVLGKNLKKITFKNGSVILSTDTTERQDLQNAHALKSIRILNTDSTFIKKLNFYYSYTSSTNPVFTSNDYLKKRMYLDSLVVSDGIQNNSKYSMDYYNRDNLPGRLSYNQDFWGYYNGAANQGLTPMGIFSLSLISPYFGPYIVPFYGADRTVRLSFAQCGNLKTLTYPTGGSNEFIYESNRVSNFPQRAEFGFDMIDTTVNVNLLGDANGIITTYSKSFSVDKDFGRSGRVMAKIQIGLPGSSSIPPPPSSSDDPDVRLILPDNTSIPLRNNVTRLLPIGNYQITADFSSNPDPDLIKEFYVNIEYSYGVISDSNTQNIAVGGLRIAKILSHESNNFYIRRYEYNDTTNYSSGILTDFPTFFTASMHCIHAITCANIIYSDVGHSALSYANGNHVAYYKVTEYNSSNGELGKSVYRYSFWEDIGNFRIFPYPPPCSMDWLRGILLKEEHFGKFNGNYALAQEKIYNYDFTTALNDSFFTTTKGVKIGKLKLDCEYAGLLTPYESVLSDTRTGWLRLKSDTTIVYSKEQPGQSIITTNSYSYNPKNFEVDTTILSSSVGSPIKKIYRYPSDYQISGNPVGNRALAIKTLKDKNIISPVIEKQTFRRKGSNDVLLNSVFNEYNSGTLKPDTILLLSSSSPINNFSASTINNNALVIDSRYEPELIYYGFDSNNNITGQSKNHNASQAFIWDYNNAYVISQVNGASFNDIAYTSFEADGSGNWTIGSSLRLTNQSLTGRKSYALSNGNISRSNLNTSTEYLLTYWKHDTIPLTITGTQGTPLKIKTTNGWSCFTHKLAGITSLTISGSGTLDELRLYPKSSQMTTYTYDPLVGVTSQCDIRNSLSYFEYDRMGQLKIIRDQDKNILKTFEYKYQNPQ
jgi:hypothetical protein